MPIDPAYASILTGTLLDPTNPATERLLHELQGNILKGHGRDFTAHVFLRFRPAQRPAAHAFIARLANEAIDTAFEQRREQELFRSLGKTVPTTPFASFHLTAGGYEALGIPRQLWPRDPRFLAGMEASGEALHDPPPLAWEPGYRQPIHALLLVAAHDEAMLARTLADVLWGLPDFADVALVERGRALRQDGRVIEHFGYADGRSQPLFFAEDVQREADGVNQLHPGERPGIVLVPDRAGGRPECFGSYLVFRKLEQDVRQFRALVEQLAQKLGVSPQLAGAYAVGRFQDGTPVILSQVPQGKPVPANNFNSSSDREAVRWPRHAHTRKAHRRAGRDAEPWKRIVRRGITYGERPDLDPAASKDQQPPGAGVGLLFQCFQADIAGQFESLQKHANDPADGIDPVIGQWRSEGNPLPPQAWPLKWGEPGTAPFAFGGCVTLKGGAYFFAPSWSFLANVSTIANLY